MAVHPKHELLVHIIDPSRSVEGNFRVYTVADRRRPGAQRPAWPPRRKTAIELIDAEAKKHVVLREDIEKLQASTKSLMPEGFEKQVKPRGASPTCWSSSRSAASTCRCRSTRSPPSSAPRGMFYDEDADAERLIFADWSPKTFEGVPFLLVDPQGDTIAQRDPAVRPAGQAPADDAQVGHAAVQRAGQGDPPALAASAAGASPTASKGSVSHDRAAALRRRPDRGPQAATTASTSPTTSAASTCPARSSPSTSAASSSATWRSRRSGPSRSRKIELVKGDDRTAPVVMAVTVETR